ncbi:zinc-dependent peptidase [Flavivirga spongiicola]|uniref:Zinc-dependent peptidase n=1 Tax=Flavivirga spongiicola TaxID=421621 RepID=A0ABU7XVP1_9FLAO|nr:zinc-dependent peptidase [Flavivirga sp. MEBiC05379]MDO5979844.1 zinc-dependent peptidase [Flavivirga sp. MEBiC05379]
MFIILVVEKYTLGSKIILGILFAVLAYMLLNYAMRMIEMGYVLKYKQPLYNHFYFRLRRLNKNQKSVLTNQFSFYKKLTAKEKKYFEHRVASFIIDKDFIGRDGIVINDEIKILIASTAVMLTFGFRDFYIGIISKIIIYPSNYYSNINKAYHKGEFNPRFKTLVLSWEDFVKGFDNESDNLNLGIHELTHAIHINSMKERDVSSIIFNDSFKELSALFSENESLRDELKASDYFRKYAFTNQFEFLAVTIENFIETPQEFRSQFPEVYNKIKQMLNFKVKGY